MMHRALMALTLCIAPSAALADAVTYRGDLNRFPIVLELSDLIEDLTTDSFGRYAKMEDGMDIPLHVDVVGDNRIEISEESVCEINEGDDNCPRDADGNIIPPPPQAIWKLAILDGGARLVGTWGGIGSTPLPVYLERTGTRPFTPYDPGGPKDLPEFAISVLWGEGPLTRESSPYDYIKAAIHMDASKETRWGNYAFRYFTDPRTLLRYPHITDIGSGGRSPAEDFMEQRNWGMNLDAMNCKSKVYLGMNWGDYIDLAAGTLGGYDEEVVEIHYLTNKLVSYSESGSLFCGGAHPYNHRNFYNLDVATGELIDLSRLFDGWIARDFATLDTVDLDTARQDPTNYDWGPDDELVAFVREHAKMDEFEYPEECDYSEMVGDYLTISFKHPNLVRFSLDGMPNVMQACSEDLLEMPVTELKALMADEAVRYFPELRN